MPKVRIKSGNETGAIKDMPQTEAENAIATGFAELYVEPGPEKDEADEPKPRVAPAHRTEPVLDEDGELRSGQRTERKRSRE